MPVNSRLCSQSHLPDCSRLFLEVLVPLGLVRLILLQREASRIVGCYFVNYTYTNQELSSLWVLTLWAETASSSASPAHHLQTDSSTKLELHGSGARRHVEDNVVYKVKIRQLLLGGSCPCYKVPLAQMRLWKLERQRGRGWVPLQEPSNFIG